MPIFESFYVSGIVDENCNRCTKGHIFRTSRVKDLGHVAFFLHLEIDNCLVCLDTAQDVTRGHSVADFFIPGSDVTIKQLFPFSDLPSP